MTSKEAMQTFAAALMGAAVPSEDQLAALRVLEADASALWAYRVQERMLLESAAMVDLAAHERKLIEHCAGVVAARPELDPDAPRSAPDAAEEQRAMAARLGATMTAGVVVRGAPSASPYDPEGIKRENDKRRREGLK